MGSEAANLVEIDRILLDAWSIQREALVTQSRLGGEQDGNPAEVRRRVVDLLTRAQDRVSDARAKLSRLHRKSTPTRAAELAARITAIDGYAATLQTSGANPQAGHGPLLAELLPLDPAPR